MKIIILLSLVLLHQLMCSVVVSQAALLNSPRQRRKGQKGTPTMKGSVTYQARHQSACDTDLL